MVQGSKISDMILANIATILTFGLALLITVLFPNIKEIPLWVMICLSYFDISIFNTTFEYQRITLTVARIAKLSEFAQPVHLLQLLMTSPNIGVLVYINAVSTGVLIAYLFLKSIPLLILFLLVRYLLNILVPTYVPFNYLFKLVGTELAKSIRSSEDFMTKIRLTRYFEELPKDKTYEKFAFQKYGKDLQKIR